MSAVAVNLTQEDVRAIAAEVARLIAPKPQRPEVTTAEAAEIVGLSSPRAFRYWASARRVRPVARGRYRTSRIIAATGGAS